MLASSIAAYETQTHNYHSTHGHLIAANEGPVAVNDYRPGHSSFYYAQPTTKRRIVLHFTAGFLGGDLGTLTTPNNHVSVSFIVARGGTIYRLFDTAYWSYHTGGGTVGGNKTISSSSIGIELSNVGYLDLAGSWLWYWTGDRYCQPGDTQYYTQLANDFRGKRYYAKFTDAQYTALNALLTALCSKHSIPRTFLATAARYSTFASSNAGQSYRGICSHVNYRPSGKWDIGPAFEWSRIGAPP